MSDQLLEKWRRDTPGHASGIHLNNAGAALPPSTVVDAICSYLKEEAIVGGYELAAREHDTLQEFYQAFGALLGTAPDRIAFAGSATDAYARALSAVPFEKGDIILTTNNDYVSNFLAFYQLGKRYGVETRRAEDLPAGGVDPQSVREHIEKRRPRLVAVTHMPTNSGLIQPVEAVGSICREANLPYFVDACQTAGQLPLDVEAIQCDVLTGTARKYLRGPRGVGFLYTSKRIIDLDWEPMFIDLQGGEWTSPERYTVHPDARRFEYWERSMGLLRGATEAVKYALEVGPDLIAQRTAALANLLRIGLAEIPGVKVVDRGPHLGAIVTCTVSGAAPKTLLTSLREKGLRISITRQAQARISFARAGIDWALRLSPHYYNTETEIAEATVLLRNQLQTSKD